MSSDENKKIYTNQPENLDDEKLTETAGGGGMFISAGGKLHEISIDALISMSKWMADFCQRRKKEREAQRKALLEAAERRRKGNFPK